VILSKLLALTVSVAALFSFQVKAIPRNEVKSYYGREFYESIRSGLKNEALKQVLHSILSQVHSKGPEDAFDQVGQGCVKSCYQHISIGYHKARIFLMGNFYLSKQNGEYAVKDVYCEKLIPESEFRGHKPGPNQLPDNRVINAEHTWPQSKFTGKFSKEMQKSDLHHLFPTDSEMNSTRSSYPFGEVVQDSQELKCREARLGSVIESRGIYFEPPDSHKGNVARALFYFSVRYRLNIDPIQEKYLRSWHLKDTPDDEELRRNEEIHALQGNRNPFIDHPELVDLIFDF